LADVWEVVSRAWAGVMGGSNLRRLKSQHGLRGYVRSTEVTHGKAGWHPHLHVLLFLDQVPDGMEHARLIVWFRRLWAARVRALGLNDPHPEHGLRLDAVTTPDGLGAYLAKVEGSKWSIGAELARTDAKAGREGSRSPFQILADLADEPTPEDGQLWQEWVVGSKGRRIIEWSRGLRAALGLTAEERTDEEIAADAEEADVVAVLSPGLWREVTRRGLTVEVLRKVQEGWLVALCPWLKFEVGLPIQLALGFGDTGPPDMSSPAQSAHNTLTLEEE
jgi:hypothetical protein